jgi:hypothetical protein
MNNFPSFYSNKNECYKTIKAQSEKKSVKSIESCDKKCFICRTICTRKKVSFGNEFAEKKESYERTFLLCFFLPLHRGNEKNEI